MEGGEECRGHEKYGRLASLGVLPFPSRHPRMCWGSEKGGDGGWGSGGISLLLRRSERRVNPEHSKGKGGWAFPRRKAAEKESQSWQLVVRWSRLRRKARASRASKHVEKFIGREMGESSRGRASGVLLSILNVSYSFLHFIL